MQLEKAIFVVPYILLSARKQYVRVCVQITSINPQSAWEYTKYTSEQSCLGIESVSPQFRAARASVVVSPVDGIIQKALPRLSVACNRTRTIRVQNIGRAYGTCRRFKAKRFTESELVAMRG